MGGGLGQKREKNSTATRTGKKTQLNNPEEKKKLNLTTLKKKKVERLVAEEKKTQQPVSQEKKSSMASCRGKKKLNANSLPEAPLRSLMVCP